MKVSLCTPMYNESSIVRDTVRTLVAYMKHILTILKFFSLTTAQRTTVPLRLLTKLKS